MMSAMYEHSDGYAILAIVDTAAHYRAFSSFKGHHSKMGRNVFPKIDGQPTVRNANAWIVL